MSNWILEYRDKVVEGAPWVSMCAPSFSHLREPMIRLAKMVIDQNQNPAKVEFRLLNTDTDQIITEEEIKNPKSPKGH